MPYNKREQPEHKAIASSGCSFCETKVKVFKRNAEAWQQPQEREECVKRRYNKNLAIPYNVLHLSGSKL